MAGLAGNHNFTQEQMQYIDATMNIKVEELRTSVVETTTNAQIAFTLSQTKLDVLFTEAQASSARMDEQVRLVNEMKLIVEAKTAEHAQGIISGTKTADAAHERLSSLLKELNEFHSDTEKSLEAIRVSGATLRQQTTEEFAKLQTQNATWQEGIRSHLERGGDMGKGKSGDGGKGSSRADKKEIAVWKLSDDLDKSAFRHWVDAVDQQLEAVHGFRHASFVMNEVRRCDSEITAETFTECIAKANVKIESSLVAMGVKGEALNGVSDDSQMDAFPDYKFLECTMFLNSYLICKLNTDLHTKTFGLEHKNGFELYRVVCQLVDAIPENAAFHLNNEL